MIEKRIFNRKWKLGTHFLLAKQEQGHQISEIFRINKHQFSKYNNNQFINSQYNNNINNSLSNINKISNFINKILMIILNNNSLNIWIIFNPMLINLINNKIFKNFRGVKSKLRQEEIDYN